MTLREEILHRFEFMAYFLNPDRVKRPSVIQFQVEDPRLSEPVCLYFQYDHTDCQVHEGEATKWTTRITVQYEFWREIQGKMVGTLRMLKEIFNKENIRVEGELGEFLRLAKTFAGTLNNRHFRPDDIAAPHPPRQAGWVVPKRILVLSGSGRSKKWSSSYHFAKRFAEGLSQATPTPKVELIHLQDFKFRECIGCFSCWGNGGRCVLKDDFETIIKPRIDACDLLVFAYPIYFYDFPPRIRAVMTRMFVNDHPQLYWNDRVNDVAHYHRTEYGFSLFLLSTGAAFDRVQLKVPEIQARLLRRRHGVPYLGCIHRQTGVGFVTPAAQTALHDKIDAALERAGLELARDGRVHPKTIKLVEKDVVTPAQLRAGARAYQAWLSKELEFPFEAPAIEPSRFDIKSAEHPKREG